MKIYDFVGDEFDEDPIKSNTAIGDVRKLWDMAQNQRLKNQMLKVGNGKKIMPYTLLYFIPGLTTYCGLRGIPVITGYMSGCYLFRFRYNGIYYAAHVGTHDTKKDWSDKAKEAWKAVARKTTVTDIWGFDPLKDVSMKLLQEAQKFGSPQIAGIWDSNGSARIAVMAKTQRGKIKFVGIEPASLRPWSSIQNDPKMR